MSFRHNVFWSVLAVAEVIIILFILGLVVFASKPEPISLSKAEMLPPTDVSTVAAITAPTQESLGVKIYIDAIYRIGKYQRILGWLFVENQEARGQEVYVQFEKPDGTVVHYTTFPVERPEVGIVFKNPLYNASGFAALIPLTDKIDVDACAVCLVVKNESGTHKSTLWETGIRFSSRAEITPPEPESQAVKFDVDINEDRKEGMYGYRYLTGWVYVTDQETRGQKVYVQLEKPDGTVVHYTTFPVERPEVGIVFKNPLYNASGFAALIPLTDKIDVDACAVCLVVKNESGTHKSTLWETGIRFSSRAEITPPEPESQAVKFDVDINEDRKEGMYGYRYLTGWVYVTDQETRGQKVYVQLEKPDGTVVHYTTFPVERPEVGIVFKNPLYNASGFAALIPLTDKIDVDACAVCLVVKNESGTHKSTLWPVSGSKKGTETGPFTAQRRVIDRINSYKISILSCEGFLFSIFKIF